MPPLPVFLVQAYRKPPGRLHLPQAQRSLRKLSLPGRQSPPGRLPAQKLPCFPRLLLPAHRSPPRPLPLPGRQSSPQQSPFPDPWYLPPGFPAFRRLRAVLCLLFSGLCSVFRVRGLLSRHYAFWITFLFVCISIIRSLFLAARSLPASQQRPP